MSTHTERRLRREKLAASVREVAQIMQVSPRYLLDLERGYRRWSADLLERHDDALAAIAKKNPALGKA